MGTEAARLSRGPASCQEGEDGHLSPRMRGTNLAPLHTRGHLPPALGEEVRDPLPSQPAKPLPFLPFPRIGDPHTLVSPLLSDSDTW